MTEFERAVSRQKILIKQLDQFNAAVQQIDDLSTEEAQTRQTHLVGIWGKFNEPQEIIENTLIDTNQDDDEIEAQIAIRTNFENRIHRLKAQLMKISASRQPESTAKASSEANPDTNGYHQRFPEITLPTFEGKIAFLDISSIHNTRLPDVKKLHYLKSSFKGEAYTFIKQFPTLGEKYEEARKAAIDRYNNEKILTNTYIKKAFAVAKAEPTFRGTLLKKSTKAQTHCNRIFEIEVNSSSNSKSISR